MEGTWRRRVRDLLQDYAGIGVGVVAVILLLTYWSVRPGETRIDRIVRMETTAAASATGLLLVAALLFAKRRILQNGIGLVVTVLVAIVLLPPLLLQGRLG